MHRFFVSPECLQGEAISLTGPLARRMGRVLRLSRGDHVVLLDDTGWAYEAELDAVTDQKVTARLVSSSQPQTELSTHLSLYQALPKARKLDWVLQKGTELGVSLFVPLFTQHCVVRSGDGDAQRKLARWRRIVAEAAEQSGRVRLPQVLPARSFAQVCQAPPPDALALMALVGHQATPLGRALRSLTTALPREVRVYVGPEGGFTADEAARARQVGIVPVSLGPRILRTETAGLVALSAILYALGDLGQAPPPST